MPASNTSAPSTKPWRERRPRSVVRCCQGAGGTCDLLLAPSSDPSAAEACVTREPAPVISPLALPTLTIGCESGFCIGPLASVPAIPRDILTDSAPWRDAYGASALTNSATD